MFHARLLVLGLLACAGCSSAAVVPEKLVEVKGKVTVKGQPLAHGSVLFMPDKELGNAATAQPSGLIKDGVFELSTGHRPGAPPGAYKVAIIANEPASSVAPVRWLANSRYASDRSGLHAEVVENPSAKAYWFDLEP
jgi:hypothetical protein